MKKNALQKGGRHASSNGREVKKKTQRGREGASTVPRRDKQGRKHAGIDKGEGKPDISIRKGGNFRGRKKFSGSKVSDHAQRSLNVSAGSSRASSARLSPRKAAFFLLEACLLDKRPLEFVEHTTLKNVVPRDRNLTRMIVYTALRRNMELDAVIDSFVEGEIGTPQVRIFLKVGLVQIFFMDTPSHAAVAETLNAVFGKALASKGMINAILRRATEEGATFLAERADIINAPKYLWKSWVAAYGEKVARQILQAHLAIAPVDISVKNMPEKWAQKLGGTLLPTGGVRIGNPGKITEVEGYKDGVWWVQDFAAQIPVLLFGKNLAGKTIIDMCAAPGGKTAQLLARGAKVIAVDHNERRLERLYENMTRLGLKENLEIVVKDAVKYTCREPADGVLLDAPCSATGTIRKHPDLPFLKDRTLILSIARLQEHMLHKGAEMLKEGGTLVFSTCSIQPEEGEMHLEKLPKTLQRSAIRRREIEGMQSILTTKGCIRTLPSMFKELGGLDGFFMARFTKKSSA